jgi:hypothetical protein
VTVWVALKTPSQVSLEVTGGDATLIGNGQTVRLANNLHVATVTANIGGALPRDRVYQYNITLSGAVNGSLLDPGILSSGGIGPSSVGPGGTGLPSFALPPDTLSQLRLLHASCRKMHGGGRDPTAAFDQVIAGTAQSHQNRPHMLFLTGDQIYSDDVADQMLVMLQDAGVALGFNSETAPGVPDVPGAGRRAELMKQVGITAGAVARSHLIRFAEFACMYLFAWSDVLWRGNDLPTLADVYGVNPTKDDQKNFESHATKLRSFRASIAAARRALANVPTYMMFDDHEITDDWFLDRLWVDKASQPTVFRRIVQNGLAAYAIFQGWGNDPSELQATKGGSTLIAGIEGWANNPNDAAQSENLVARLGMPIATPGTGAAYGRNPDAVNWHYSYVDTALPFRVAVLDTRTRRQYGAKKHDAPGLIVPAELASQLTAIPASSVDGETLMLIVSPSPAVGYPMVETVQGVATVIDKYFPDPEFWPRHPTSFHHMVAALGAPQANSKRRIVVLSGDVHYAFTSVLRYRATRPIGQTATATANASFVQLTSSSQKNEEPKTLGLHYANIPMPTLPTFGFNNPGGGTIRIGQRGLNPTLSVDLERTGDPIIYEPFPPQLFTPFATNTTDSPPKRAPDWTAHTSFEKSKTKRAATLPPPVPPGNADLQDHLAVLGGHLTYVHRVVGGTNVVGTTNVGQVTFEWGADNDKFVTHELFWFQGAAGAASVLTSFTAHLDLT